MALATLSLGDEANVCEALKHDLDDFWKHARLEVTDNTDDTWSAAEDIVADGDKLAAVLPDHRLPEKSGVDSPMELMEDPRFSPTRTVLAVSQVDQDGTIRALNEAGLDHYTAKPWDPVNLQEVVRHQFTDFVLEAGASPLPHLPVLDGVRVIEAVR